MRARLGRSQPAQGFIRRGANHRTGVFSQRQQTRHRQLEVAMGQRSDDLRPDARLLVFVQFQHESRLDVEPGQPFQRAAGRIANVAFAQGREARQPRDVGHVAHLSEGLEGRDQDYFLVAVERREHGQLAFAAAFGHDVEQYALHLRRVGVQRHNDPEEHVVARYFRQQASGNGAQGGRGFIGERTLHQRQGLPRVNYNQNAQRGAAHGGRQNRIARDFPQRRHRTPPLAGFCQAIGDAHDYVSRGRPARRISVIQQGSENGDFRNTTQVAYGCERGRSHFGLLGVHKVEHDCKRDCLAARRQGVDKRHLHLRSSGSPQCFAQGQARGGNRHVLQSAACRLAHLRIAIFEQAAKVRHAVGFADLLELSHERNPRA